LEGFERMRGIGIAMVLMAVVVQGAPWPAPDLQNCIDLPIESCCTPVLYNGTSRKFEYQPGLPMRTRQAAHLVDAEYTAKITKAYALMRALPDTDPRSFNNQANLHCAYCDNHFFYPEYPNSRLEIHRNWLFLPWHRLFIYHHERILAKLLGDDTFALPFWDFDNQSSQKPEGNTYPLIYRNKDSPLFDPLRQACSAYPRLVDFQDPFQFCPNKTADYQRFQNAHAMYTQIVATPTLPTLFHGEPYRYGDIGAVGGGTIEVKPHGSMHVWANVAKATFTNSASDPIFYALHAEIDRLWKLWMKIPGGIRTYPNDPDWLNTEFAFYDEDGKTVIAAVHHALDTKLLRYATMSFPFLILFFHSPQNGSRARSDAAGTSFRRCRCRGCTRGRWSRNRRVHGRSAVSTPTLQRTCWR
jgi:polyphenol oxidase